MKALIVYCSHAGKTARYGREMAFHLYRMGVSVSICATSDFKADMLKNCDLLLLGCWTKGRLLFFQRPPKSWIDFAQQLPTPLPPQLLLFTTYKYRVGSLFRQMRKWLDRSTVTHEYELKSKVDLLTEADKEILAAMLRQAQNKSCDTASKPR